MPQLDLAVLGLGYVGMPLAYEASLSGLSVVGVDIDGDVVDGLMAGHSHIRDVSDEDLSRMLAGGFTATIAADVISAAATVVICVPTPLDDQRRPNISAVQAAARRVSAHLAPGTLVVLESTTYPGTTEEVILPILEQSGLAAGTDFFLAFSPERIDPGNPEFSLRNTPKIVGGHTATCATVAESFYSRIVNKVVPVRGTREAEMAKLLENTYRYVNVGLINEMLLLSDALGLDFWEVVGAAATKPFGFQSFTPGPGVGGHCIPVDPIYLSHRLRDLGSNSEFIDIADRTNERMPRYVAARVMKLLPPPEDRPASVALLGVAYKEDVADARESPAVPLAEHLVAAGADVRFHDPYIEYLPVRGADLAPLRSLDEAFRFADVVVVLQRHSQYVNTSFSPARLVLDTRGFLHGDNVVRL
ncbi:nucleotide sugar dehydrogenase [Micromonospora sp. WMMD980]|uniref:nucleotide sugar dehydrogenase n=1 Tax=Micromonospora sp. WMMD980 TaxID=3016088 RepID=UPI0024171015|nr:nucleotide sugar dehydrogenase [Micromonospora sp. WMMD980]MDG4803234.1 nucleotide sugar dehydrogenase [Micromonospora sp. WMMD980]